MALIAGPVARRGRCRSLSAWPAATGLSRADLARAALRNAEGSDANVESGSSDGGRWRFAQRRKLDDVTSERDGLFMLGFPSICRLPAHHAGPGNRIENTRLGARTRSDPPVHSLNRLDATAGRNGRFVVRSLVVSLAVRQLLGTLRSERLGQKRSRLRRQRPEAPLDFVTDGERLAAALPLPGFGPDLHAANRSRRVPRPRRR